jgi:tripartite-type tricarboxylate transporter receptor subunit TctC
VPAKTPVVIIARLNKEIVQILNRPETAEALLKSGMEPWSSTPDAFGAYLKAEYNKWGHIIKAAGISAH